MTKPRLDETTMTDELGAVASFARPRPSDEQPAITPPPTSELETRTTHQTGEESTGQSTSRPTPQSANRPTDRGSSAIVDRPKAFYITIRLDRRLNEAVRYFQETHGLKKVDRSAIVNAMLDVDERWTNEALDGLVKRVMDQLTSRLVD